MGLERRNPLPTGRYWMHLHQEQGGRSFDAWRQRVGARLINSAFDADTGWTWYLFQTTAPAEWNAAEWGWPNTAGPEVRTEADVVQRPPPEPGVLESLESAANKTQSRIWYAAAFAVVGVYAVNRLIK